MAAALFSITIKVAIIETIDNVSSTLLVPVTLTGNHLEKLNLDVPVNSTVVLSVPLPINTGIDFIGLAASGANLTITSDDDDDSNDTVNLVKGQPILYYPAG